jgi:hypothetical protein
MVGALIMALHLVATSSLEMVVKVAIWELKTILRPKLYIMDKT